MAGAQNVMHLDLQREQHHYLLEPALVAIDTYHYHHGRPGSVAVPCTCFFLCKEINKTGVGLSGSTAAHLLIWF